MKSIKAEFCAICIYSYRPQKYRQNDHSKTKCKGLNILTLFLRSITVKIMKKFCRFVFCDNIDSFWRLLSLKFIGKSPARTPLLHHLRQHQSFLSSVLLSTTKLSTNQLARNHSVIAKISPTFDDQGPRVLCS